MEVVPLVANGATGHVGLTVDAPNPEMLKFKAKFYQEYKYLSDHNGIKGYTGVYILKNAIEKVGKLDRVAVAKVLHELADQGNTVVVIEHNLDVVKTADWLLDFGPEGGETLVDFYARSVTTAAELAARHPGQTIALVAHGGVLDCLYRAATRLDLQAPRTWDLSNTTINRLLWTPEGLSLVGWADTTHLQGGALDETTT